MATSKIMSEAFGVWLKEPGPRIEGDRDLDMLKPQAPGVVRTPSGGFRLYYTAVGPGKPYPKCQGYILSAVSDDGLSFRKEPGIRLAPRLDIPYMNRRVIAPTVTQCGDDRWRMYFESRGPAGIPRVICSAVSMDMLEWKLEEGIRLEGFGGLGGPRYMNLPDGSGKLHCIAVESGCGASRSAVISAVTSDGLNFEIEPGCRKGDQQSEYDARGITAAEVIPPRGAGSGWTMVYSAWQDAPKGAEIPGHPSTDDSLSEDFAVASIRCDMAGFRSRIFISHSENGLDWDAGKCIIEGGGHDSDDIDGVHAEDMSVVELDDGRYRMYYASCDRNGIWRIASAISV